MRWNLRSKLILPIFLVMSLGITSITYISYNASSNLVETEIGQKIKQLNFLLNHHITNFLDRLTIDFKEIAEDPSLSTILLSHMSSMQNSAVKMLLTKLVEQRPDIYSVALLDDRGTVKISSSAIEEGLSYQHYAFFQQALDSRTLIFSAPFTHPRFKTQGIFIAQPVLLNQKTIGVLVGFFKIEALSTLFTTIVDLGNLGYAFILEPNGKFIAHPDPKLYLKNIKQFSFGYDMLKVKDNFFEYVYKNRTTISYLSTLKQVNWIVGIRLDKTEAFNHLAAIRNQIISIGIALVLIIALLLFYSTHKILTPLMKIKHYLAGLAAGNPLAETHISYNGKDEIQDLVQTVQRLKLNMNETIQMANAIAQGHYEYEVQIRSEQDQLNQAIANMTANLRTMTEQTQQQDWLKTGQMELANQIRGEHSFQQLSEIMLYFIADYLKVEVGAFYLFNNEGQHTYLERIATHACVLSETSHRRFTAQDGLLGQVLTQKQPVLIQEAPPDYLYVKSGLGQSQPYQVLLMPILHEGVLKGVLELATLQPFSELQNTFLTTVLPSLAIALNSATVREHMQQLLTQMQTQTEELQTQAEELRVQQEELQQANEVLHARSGKHHH